MKPIITKRKCPAQEKFCKIIAACPNTAIFYMADENEPLGGRIVINLEKCNNCGACVTACCGQAVTIE
jgi:NAD-dependent dihydropyrimidine dehydrogenase PreA subunit